jgi:hypothetical protein
VAGEDGEAGLDLPGAHRELGLGAVERLDLGLLVVERTA